MRVSLKGGSMMLLVAMTVACPASAPAGEPESVTLHVGDEGTGRRVVLEETPMPVEEPEAVGAVTLAVVVYQGKREIGRFAIEGNQGGLATDVSSLPRPVVLAISKSCGGSCSSLHVTAVEVPQKGNPKEVFRQQFFGGDVIVTPNGFTVREPEYAAGEPNCCPSREKVSTFKRRGAGYKMVRSRVQARGS